MSSLRRALLTPLWVVQIFGMSKSFTENPVIGSPLLNRLGLHVARLVAAHALNRIRLLLLAPLAAAADRKAFREQGYLLIPNFLPPAEFAAIEAERGNAGARCESASRVIRSPTAS